jgi:hypothetical protein
MTPGNPAIKMLAHQSPLVACSRKQWFAEDIEVAIDLGRPRRGCQGQLSVHFPAAPMLE